VENSYLKPIHRLLSLRCPKLPQKIWKFQVKFHVKTRRKTNKQATVPPKTTVSRSLTMRLTTPLQQSLTKNHVQRMTPSSTPTTRQKTRSVRSATAANGGAPGDFLSGGTQRKLQTIHANPKKTLRPNGGNSNVSTPRSTRISTHRAPLLLLRACTTYLCTPTERAPRRASSDCCARPTISSNPGRKG